MEKFTKVVIIIILSLLCLILQIYVLDKLPFMGARANILLTFCVVLAIWQKPNISIPVSVTIGLVSDMIFTFSIGKYLITYVVLTIITITMSNFYNKENRGATVLIILITTILAEYIFGIFNLIKYATFANVFSIALVGIKGATVNVVLGALLSKIIKKIDSKEK